MTLAENVIAVHGDAGRAFLARLPSLLDDVASRFGVVIGAPYELTYHYVARADRAGDGAHLVVRCGLDLADSTAALRFWNGRGAVKLVEAGDEFQLLERVAPGERLDRTNLDDDARIRAIASVIRALTSTSSSAPPPLLPTVEQWGRGFARLRARFDGGTGPFPAGLVDAAERTWGELTTTSRAVLHGDLHGGNVLSSGASWLAVDPHGVVGEPAFECGCAIRNAPLAFVRRAVDLFADELALDPVRVSRWAFAQAVLSAWWTYEDHGVAGAEALAVAAAL